MDELWGGSLPSELGWNDGSLARYIDMVAVLNLIPKDLMRCILYYTAEIPIPERQLRMQNF